MSVDKEPSMVASTQHGSERIAENGKSKLFARPIVNQNKTSAPYKGVIFDVSEAPSDPMQPRLCHA